MNQPLRPSRGKVPPYPTAGEFINPRWTVGFFRAFLGSWLVTRNFRSLVAGAPAVAFLCIGGASTWQRSKDPGDELAVTYERAAVAAGRLGADAEADLMWERLMQLRADDKRYQFVLATRLVDQEKYAEAQRHLDVLTGSEGYTPARMWLVTHARGESPVFELTSDQQVQQLQAAVTESPQNAGAHRLLAQLHVEREDFRVAEKHLTQAVERHAVLGLPLFELQLRLGRSNERESKLILRRAAAALEDLVVADPQNVENRIYWAQSLIYLGETTEAEAILTEAVKSNDSTKLSEATASLMIGQAQQLLRKSSLNTTPAASYLKKAVQIHPQHPALATMVVGLASRGASFSEQELASLIDHLKTQLTDDEVSVNSRVQLGQIYTLLKLYPQAAELLEAGPEEHPAVQALLVRVYREQGKTADVEQLTKSMIAGLSTDAADKPGDVGAMLALMDGYLVAKRYADAVELADRHCEESGQEIMSLPPLVRTRYVAACLAARGTGADEEQAMSWFQKAVNTGIYTPELIQLIARTSVGDTPVAIRAQELITTMLANGSANIQIYSALGTHALAADNLDVAIQYLRLAVAQVPGNPVLNNNLALALIRSSRDNYAEALELCNAALTRMPRHPDVLSTRAEVMLARKRWAEARQDLEAALPSRPKNIAIRKMLVEVYSAIREPSLAKEHQQALDRLNAAADSASE